MHGCGHAIVRCPNRGRGGLLWPFESLLRPLRLLRARLLRARLLRAHMLRATTDCSHMVH